MTTVKEATALSGVLALALLVAAPAAAADQAAIYALYDEIAEIEKSYGFPEMPDLTEEEWDQYYAEWDELHEQLVPHYATLGEMNQQYDEIQAQLDKLDDEAKAIDEKYGIEPYPELTHEQWEQYDAEANMVYDKMDEYWAEYDQKVASNPDLAPDHDAIDALYDEIAEIDKKYGIPGWPEMTAEEWEQYDSELQELEKLREPHYEDLMAVHLPYQDVFDEMAQIDVQGRAIDQKYGISHEQPEMTDAEWQAYLEETDAIYRQINDLEADMWDKQGESFESGMGYQHTEYPKDGHDTEYEEAFSAMMGELGVTMPGWDEDPEFHHDFEQMMAENEAMQVLGKPGIPADEREMAYQTLSEIAPQIREFYEDRGYTFPLSTPQDFEELDKRMLELDHMTAYPLDHMTGYHKDGHDMRYEEDFSAMMGELGVTMPGWDEDPEFHHDFEQMMAENEAMQVLGKPGIPADEREMAYQTLSEIAPQIREFYEDRGYTFPLSTPQDFEELDKRMLELNQITASP